MIIPSGKKRVMYAQNYDGNMRTGIEVNGQIAPTPQPHDNASENESKNLGAFDELLPSDELSTDQEAPVSLDATGSGLDDVNSTPESTTDLKEQESAIAQPDPKHEGDQGDGSPDLTEFIFKVVEGLGYPPRRLEEFSDEFVQESIFPGNVREVTIVIPDRYYGMRKRVSSSDFAKVVQGIQKKFGLNFVSAERKQKKITMSFSSQKPAEEGSGEVVGDDLDQVYGGGNGGGKGKKPTAPKKPAADNQSRAAGSTVQPVGKNVANHVKQQVTQASTQREMMKVSSEQFLKLIADIQRYNNG